MKFRLFFIFLLFPLSVFADGAMVSHYTLEAVQVAVLAKVLFFDAKKNMAHVKILKVFSKGLQPSDELKARVLPENGSSLFQLSILQVGKDLHLPLQTPPPQVPGVWVEEEKYWNHLPEIVNGKETLFLLKSRDFEPARYEPRDSEKLELIFDAAKMKARLSKMKPAELEHWKKDPDLKDVAEKELEKYRRL